MDSKKRKYTKPEIVRIELDYSISLVMMTSAPPGPPPRGLGDSKRDPFESPFADKPFS